MSTKIYIYKTEKNSFDFIDLGGGGGGAAGAGRRRGG
jgi:hypothetical protein